jgi:hypothetical protein
MLIGSVMIVPVVAAVVVSNLTRQTHGQTRTSLDPFRGGIGGRMVQIANGKRIVAAIRTYIHTMAAAVGEG